MMERYHGDEPEIDEEFREIKEEYQDNEADEWKYTEEYLDVYRK